MRPIVAVNVFLTFAAAAVLITAPWTKIDLIPLAYESLTVASFTSTAFTVLYATRSRWRQFAAGRSLLYVSAMLSGTLALISAFYHFGPDYWGRTQLIFIGFTGMAIVLINLLLTLLRIQHAKATGELPPGEVTRAPGRGAVPDETS